MKFGVIVFPGSNCDHDAYHVISKHVGQPVDFIWHRETDLSSYDALIIPGGFSYGDYLRAGALASFSPVMASVKKFAAQDKLVLGICNGFQILCEAGLLPGALMRNAGLKFVSRPVRLRVERSDTPFTTLYQTGEVLELPIAHGDGRYAADARTLAQLDGSGQVVLRYVGANPNGSADHIAGVCNAGRNIVGIMPHPERRNGVLLGGDDGARFFLSMEARNATPHAAGDVRAAGGRHLRV